MYVLFVGDFFQLPPVQSKPVIGPASEVKVKDRRGRQLWKRAVTEAVVLTEQVRASEDPELQSVLAEGRKGNWTDKAKELFKSRVIGVASLDPGKCKAPEAVVVGENKVRVQVNSRIIKRVIDSYKSKRDDPADQGGGVGLKVLRLRALFTGSKRNVAVARTSLFSSAARVKLDTELVMVPGMEYVLNDSVSVGHHLANGQRLVYRGYTLGAGQVVQPVVDGDDTVCRVVAGGGGEDAEDALPAVLWMQIPGRARPAGYLGKTLGEDAAGVAALEAAVGEDWYPVSPLMARAVTATGKVKLRGGTETRTRTVSVRVSQFPLRPAIALTAWGVQGDTLNGVLVAELCGGHCANSSLYVALSRVKSSDGLYFFQAPGDTSNAWFQALSMYQPHKDVSEEEERLMKLEQVMRRRWQGELGLELGAGAGAECWCWC